MLSNSKKWLLPPSKNEEWVNITVNHALIIRGLFNVRIVEIVAINLVHEVNYRIKDYCREWKTYWIKIKLVMII